MTISFTRAQRKRASLFGAFIGPSFSGKTYSALLTARGLVGPEGKIALLDTQAGQGEMYDHLTPYDVARLDPPYEPERFEEIVSAAESAGYDCLIIDSFSDEWSGRGGITDIHDAATEARRDKNSFAAWATITPRHDRLMDKLLLSRMHILVTMLAKVQYEVVQNAKGRSVPQKIGLAPIQKPDIERRFNVAFTLDNDGNRAVASKDVTGLFTNCSFVPSVATGEMLAHWLEQGVLPPAEPAAEPPAPEPSQSTPPSIDVPSQSLWDAKNDIMRRGMKESRVSAWCEKKWGKPLRELTDPQLRELRAKLPHLAERAAATAPPRESINATLPPETAISAGEAQDVPDSLDLDLE